MRTSRYVHRVGHIDPAGSVERDPGRLRELADPAADLAVALPVLSRHVVHAHDAAVLSVADVDPARGVDPDSMRVVELLDPGTERAEDGPVGARQVVDADDPVVAAVGDVDPAVRVDGHAPGLLELADAGAGGAEGHPAVAQHVVHVHQAVVVGVGDIERAEDRVGRAHSGGDGAGAERRAQFGQGLARGTGDGLLSAVPGHRAGEVPGEGIPVEARIAAAAARDLLGQQAGGEGALDRGQTVGGDERVAASGAGPLRRVGIARSHRRGLAAQREGAAGSPKRRAGDHEIRTECGGPARVAGGQLIGESCRRGKPDKPEKSGQDARKPARDHGTLLLSKVLRRPTLDLDYCKAELLIISEFVSDGKCLRCFAVGNCGRPQAWSQSPAQSALGWPYATSHAPLTSCAAYESALSTLLERRLASLAANC